MIRIAKLTDYGILLLTCFVGGGGDPLRSARDLSEESGIPLPTVSKLLKILSRGGLLASHRGIRGGYRLAREPGKITIAEVVSAIEGPIGVTECGASPPGLCDLEPVCPVRTPWQRVNEVVRKALKDLTLADMGRPVPAAGPDASLSGSHAL